MSSMEGAKDLFREEELPIIKNNMNSSDLKYEGVKQELPEEDLLMAVYTGEVAYSA